MQARSRPPTQDCTHLALRCRSEERRTPGSTPAHGPAEEGAATRSVGQYLANQRRLRRISLEELSERTSIPRRNLERLESGAFDDAADGFARGFVRTVAEALGLDANEAVMRLVDEPRADEVRALAAARRAILWRVGALAGSLLALSLGAVLYLALRERARGRPPLRPGARRDLPPRRGARAGRARASGAAVAGRRAASALRRMAALESEALILRSVDFGESDRILHLLVPEAGRLTAIAKGARRSVRRFAGTLDLFNHLRVRIDWQRPGRISRLDQARLLRGFAPLRSDPARFALGCYLLELLDRLAPEGANRADATRLFAFALQTLEWIAARPAVGAAARAARAARARRAGTAPGAARTACAAAASRPSARRRSSTSPKAVRCAAPARARRRVSCRCSAARCARSSRGCASTRISSIVWCCPRARSPRRSCCSIASRASTSASSSRASASCAR